MAGARKDFPDRPITLAVFDPAGEPILKARYRPGQGVQYQIAHETPADAAPRRATPAARPAPAAGRPPVPVGRDRGRPQVRRLGRGARQGLSPLRRGRPRTHGRLWFGVTREVKPADVPELTRSLLEGARKEFPRGELVATVFDPEGERIGKAHLAADGKVRWEK